jgi:hypothetical protein
MISKSLLLDRYIHKISFLKRNKKENNPIYLPPPPIKLGERTQQLNDSMSNYNTAENGMVKGMLLTVKDMQ